MKLKHHNTSAYDFSHNRAHTHPNTIHNVCRNSWHAMFEPTALRGECLLLTYSWYKQYTETRMPPHIRSLCRKCKLLIIFTPARLKTRSPVALIRRHRGSKRCSIRVSWRLALQVQRIYHSEEADKSCSIFMAKENKMSTCPPKKTSCLHVHSSREMSQKNPPIWILSRPGAHV